MRSSVLFGMVAALILCTVAIVNAKEYDGTITKIDGDNLTVKVGDAEKVFVVTEATKYQGGAKKDTPASKETLSKALERSKGSLKAKIETEEKDGKEVVKGGNAVVAKVSVAGKKTK